MNLLIFYSRYILNIAWRFFPIHVSALSCLPIEISNVYRRFVVCFSIYCYDLEKYDSFGIWKYHRRFDL